MATLAADPGTLTDRIGWFPFPTAPGGKGTATEGFGGADGFAVGKDAPPETIDFLKYLSSVDVQKKVGATQSLLPVAEGSQSTVTDPNLKVITESLAESTSMQNYLNQSYSPAVSTAIDEQVQAIFGQVASPQEAADAITVVAQR